MTLHLYLISQIYWTLYGFREVAAQRNRSFPYQYTFLGVSVIIYKILTFYYESFSLT